MLDPPRVVDRPKTRSRLPIKKTSRLVGRLAIAELYGRHLSPLQRCQVTVGAAISGCLCLASTLLVPYWSIQCRPIPLLRRFALWSGSAGEIAVRCADRGKRESAERVGNSSPRHTWMARAAQIFKSAPHSSPILNAFWPAKYPMTVAEFRKSDECGSGFDPPAAANVDATTPLLKYRE
jgi:hypothetical protein